MGSERLSTVTTAPNMTEMTVSPKSMPMYAIVSLVNEWSPASLELGGITSGGMSPEDIQLLMLVIVIY
jgi:hypothetical protein